MCLSLYSLNATVRVGVRRASSVAALLEWLFVEEGEDPLVHSRSRLLVQVDVVATVWYHFQSTIHSISSFEKSLR